MKTIKAIITDLDGTLLNSNKEVDTNTLNYLKDFQNNQGIVIIATSRHLYDSECYYKKINCGNTYLITSNGLYTYDNNETLINKLDYVSQDTLNYILSKCSKEKLTIVNNKNDYIYHSDNVFFDYIKSVANNITNKKRKIFIFNQLKKVDSIEKIIIFNKHNIYIDESMCNLLKLDKYDVVLNKNTDKYYACKKLLDILRIDEDDVYVFGDDINDLLLLKNFNNSFSMSNSSNYIKSISNYVTSTNNDMGVLKALIGDK